MKLSVYLFKDDVKKFKDALLEKSLKDRENPFVKLGKTGTVPYPCVAYIQENKSKTPAWASFIGGVFDLSSLDLQNQSNSVLILLKANGRVFAVTFGYGATALDRSKIEHRFGLMVAANCLHHEQIRAMEMHLVDVATRNRRTQFGSGSRVSDFDLTPHVDSIHRMTGKPTSDEIGRSVSGADSVSVSGKFDINDLGKKCKQLLKLFMATDYKKSFGFLDHLWPLRNDEAVVKSLNAELTAKLTARSHERIAVALPEIINDELLDYYKIRCGKVNAQLDDVDLDAVYRFMTQFNIAPDLEKITIVGIGQGYACVTKCRALREYLVAEIDYADESYIYCFGHWYRANKDYVKSVREEVAAIEDVTAPLNLDAMGAKEKEGDYNERIVAARGWLTMDKKNFQLKASYDKVEVCDIITNDLNLLCVKKACSSSSLSHLFGQGSVSSRLLHDYPEYLECANKAIIAKWPGKPKIEKSDLSVVKVVYAIATPKPGTLASSMFFFSLVNLINHAREVRRSGCRVALCRIGRIGKTAPLTPAPRKPKVKKGATTAVVTPAIPVPAPSASAALAKSV